MAIYKRLGFYACGTSSWEALLHFHLMAELDADDNCLFYDLGQDWKSLLDSTPGNSEQRNQSLLFSERSREGSFGAEKIAPAGTVLFAADMKSRKNDEAGNREESVAQLMESRLERASAIAFLNASGGCGGGAGPFFPSVSAARRNFGVLNLSTGGGLDRQYLNLAYSLPLYNSRLSDEQIEQEAPSGPWITVEKAYDLLIVVDPDAINAKSTKGSAKYRRASWPILEQRYKKWNEERTDTDQLPEAVPLNKTYFMADQYMARVCQILADSQHSGDGSHRDLGDIVNETLREVPGGASLFDSMFVPHLWPMPNPYTLAAELGTDQALAEFVSKALNEGCLCGGCEVDDALAAVVIMQGPGDSFWDNEELGLKLDGKPSSPRQVVMSKLGLKLGKAKGRLSSRWVQPAKDNPEGCRVCILLYGPAFSKLGEIELKMEDLINGTETRFGSAIEKLEEARTREELEDLGLSKSADRVIWEDKRLRIAERYQWWLKMSKMTKGEEDEDPALLNSLITMTSEAFEDKTKESPPRGPSIKATDGVGERPSGNEPALVESDKKTRPKKGGQKASQNEAKTADNSDGEPISDEAQSETRLR